MIRQKLILVALALFIGLSISCDKQIDSPKQTSNEQTSDTNAQSLTLDHRERSLEVGERLELTATIAPEEAKGATILWSSSNTEVASVSAKGEVVALAEGEATITVQIKDAPKITASCLVLVRPKAAEDEEANKSSDNTDTPSEGGSDRPNEGSNASEGGSEKSNEGSNASEGGSDKPNEGSNANEGDSDKPNEGINASEGGSDKPDEGSNTSEGGSDKPNEEGNTSGTPDKSQDEPKHVAVQRISLSKQEHRLALGEELLLTTKIEPENATNKAVQWSSNHPEVASVSATGLVRAHRSGEATIRVRTEDGGQEAQCRILISQPEPPKPPTPKVAVAAVSVELEPSQLQVGRELQMKEVLIPSNATDKRVTWHLSNPDVATISPTGLLKGVKVGSTRITVRSVDGGKEWTSREVYITPFQLGVGDQYLNLVGVNTQGTPTSLKQIVDEGHYTLIDFWGEWCYYCKLDLPKIKAIWDKYRARGLRVVGVSSGDSFATHQWSVQRHGITWPQIIDKNDSRAFQRIYGITGYPHVMLLDKKGKIIGWKIGAQEAENIIQSIFDREGSL